LRDVKDPKLFRKSAHRWRPVTEIALFFTFILCGLVYLSVSWEYVASFFIVTVSILPIPPSMVSNSLVSPPPHCSP
jgi:TRAP-type C4-dicarboxylate transport system permease small subunit